MPSPQLTLLFIGPPPAAGLDAQADRLADTVLLQVALDVVLLLLLLLLLFARACRRGVMFFFLSSVISCHNALTPHTQQHGI